MARAIFTAGLRTPFGRALKGAYRDVRADDLLVELLRAHFPDTGDSPWRSIVDQVGLDDVIVGCAYPEGEQGFNVARMAALGTGLAAPGMTVNRLCASSLEAVAIAASRIESGWGKVYLTAGLESMSRVPRRGANFSESEQILATAPEAYIGMGDTAEVVARRYPDITRSRQEDLAARSHELAATAYDRGDYDRQIHPFLIDRDEFIRVPVNREKMAGLQPAFAAGGIVTAATSSPLTDGATSGWVLDQQTANSHGISQGLEILDCVVSHVAPEVMGLGPIPAIRELFTRHGLQPDDVAAYEINEAFAVQVLATVDELGLPLERINAWGGAMALGHPLGASGLRLVMTLHDRLLEREQPGALGIAALCVGGGQGMAMLVRGQGSGVRGQV